MNSLSKFPLWWGAPKKFDPNFEERKISWLELFYDLVYVIAISRITHFLCTDLTLANFGWYCSLFALIFWGWINGSLYHDIHGNQGLRTRLMTLWQMIIISAFAVTIDHSHDGISHATTIVLMVMQVFITYLWWSVGLYDKEHRKYNLPYTVLFLSALALMWLGLYLPNEYRPLIMVTIIVLNYTPPFVSSRILRRNSLDLPLSASMTERLGLFTIIVFGEVVLGVVNGVSKIASPDLTTIVIFMLSMSIVFTLWWLFFTLISNRNAKMGFVNATLLEILYVPTLIALGLIAAAFTLLFSTTDTGTVYTITCSALALFPACISIMMGMLVYPEEIRTIFPKVRISLFVTAAIFACLGAFASGMTTIYFLLVVLIILTAEIAFLNSLYYTRLPSTTNED